MEVEGFQVAGLTLLCLLLMISISCCYDPFMDNDLFSIKWAGPLDLNLDEVESLGERHVMITTNHKERYRCILPETKNIHKDDAASYTGPSVDELLKPLFKATHCSYRIESFWTYELCHGKHLRQYHETKEQGKPPKSQEYYLGFGNHRDSLKEKEATESSEIVKESSLPVRELDGISLPYFEIIMDDGTKCDLTGKPRKSHVLYMCQPEGRGEVYELKESSSCEYDVIVLTALLCAHPTYRPKSEPISEIRCHALTGTSSKPSELYRVEHESRYLQQAAQEYLQQQVLQNDNTQRQPQVHRKKEDVDEVEVEEMDVPGEETAGTKKLIPTPEKKWLEQPKLGVLTDKQTLRDFITGSQCLTGGTGWWKHEVCFGKFAKQYHKDKGAEANIFLGYWDKEQHVAWLRANPAKRPRPAETRKMVSLLYTDGDLCDLTGRPRTCEVRIKCLPNMKNPHAVILSLSEPETCQYVLTVESALFCSVVKEADANGMFDHIEL